MSRVTLRLGYMSSVTSRCDSVATSQFVRSIRPPYVDGTLRLESVNADGHFLMKTGHFMSHYAECKYVDGHFMLGSSKR